VTERLLPHGLFLGMPICIADTAAFIDLLTDPNRLAPGAGIRVGYLNAWTTVLASRNASFAAMMANQLDIVYSDGMGVVWGARWLGVPVPERINAADCIVDFLRMCASRNQKVYLIGGKDGVAKGAASKWTSLVPGLQIVGAESGYLEDPAMAAVRVRESGADILLLGMGSPTQENWAVAHGQKSGARIIWCVGAMMEFHSGLRYRAPEWMRRMGLEWLVRLVVEPGRMWRRYLIGNLVFVWLVFRGRPLVQ
jgi:N-acetylglucosaminyldiphosphoundecaprenol N-acetyl-beta-D-mannosaminyltransferase